jgi:hypothetical protein
VKLDEQEDYLKLKKTWFKRTRILGWLVVGGAVLMIVFGHTFLRIPAGIMVILVVVGYWISWLVTTSKFLSSRRKLGLRAGSWEDLPKK